MSGTNLSTDRFGLPPVGVASDEKGVSSSSASTLKVFLTTPIHQLAPAVLAQVQIQSPATYDAILATQGIFNSCRDALLKKEGELTRCVEVGQDVLNQLNALQAHCSHQDTVISRLERELAASESKKQDFSNKVESLQAELAVASSRVKELTAAAATSFTDPSTATTLGKAHFLQEEHNRVLDDLAVKEASLEKETALLRASELANSRLEREAEELRANCQECSAQLSLIDNQRAATSEANLLLEHSVSQACELLNSIQTKRAAVMHHTSRSAIARSNNGSGSGSNSHSASPSLDSQHQQLLGRDFVISERVTMPSNADELKTALAEVDNQYTILQLLIPSWRSEADSGRDDFKTLKHANDVARRENELLRREIKISKTTATASDGRSPSPPQSARSASLGGVNFSNKQPKCGCEDDGMSHRSASRGGSSPRGASLSKQDLEIRGQLQRSLHKAEDRIRALEHQILEFEKDNKKEKKKNVRLIRHEELANTHFQLQNSEETNRQLREENKRLRAGFAATSSFSSPTTKKAVTYACLSQTDIAGPVVSQSEFDRRLDAARIPPTVASHPEETVSAQELSMLRAEFNEILDLKLEELKEKDRRYSDLLEQLRAFREQQRSEVDRSFKDEKVLLAELGQLRQENELLKLQLEQQLTATEMLRNLLARHGDPQPTVNTDDVGVNGVPPLPPRPLQEVGLARNQQQQHRTAVSPSGRPVEGVLSSPARQHAAIQEQLLRSAGRRSKNGGGDLSLEELSVIQQEPLDPLASPPHLLVAQQQQGSDDEHHHLLQSESIPVVAQWARSKERDLSLLREENARLEQALQAMKEELLSMQQGIAEAMETQRMEKAKSEGQLMASKEESDALRAELEKMNHLVKSREGSPLNPAGGSGSPRAVVIRERADDGEHEAISIYKKEIEKRNKQLEAVEVENADLTHQVHSLESKLRASKNAEKFAEQKVEEEQERTREVQGQVSNLREKNHESQTELDSINQLLEEQMLQTKQVTRELAEAEERWSTAEKALETFKATFHDYKQKHRLPLSVQKDLEEDCAHLREELSNARKDALAMKCLAEEKESEFDDLDKRIEDLINAVETCKTNIAESLQEVNALISHCETTQRPDAAKLCEFFVDLLLLLKEPLRRVSLATAATTSERSKAASARGALEQPSGLITVTPGQSEDELDGLAGGGQFSADYSTTKSQRQQRGGSSTINRRVFASGATPGSMTGSATVNPKTQTRLIDVVAVINQSEDLVVSLREDIRRKEDAVTEMEDKMQQMERNMIQQGKQVEQGGTITQELEKKIEAIQTKLRETQLSEEKLDNQVHERDMEIRKLKSALERCKKDAQAVAEELQEMNDKYARLQEEKVSGRKKMSEEHDRTVEKMEHEISELRMNSGKEAEKMQSLQERYDEERTQMRIEISSLSNRYTAAATRLEQTEQALQASRQLLEEANRTVLEVGELERMDAEDIKTQHAVLEKLLREKEAALETLRLENGDLAREYSKAKEEVKHLQSQLDSERHHLRSEIERSSLSAANAEQQNALKKQLDKSMAEAAEIRVLRDNERVEFEYLKQQVVSLTTQKKELQAQYEAVTRELAARNELYDALEVRCQRLENDNIPLHRKLQDQLVVNAMERSRLDTSGGGDGSGIV